jgi:putative nucleotidyltransferase with HDIG domain
MKKVPVSDLRIGDKILKFDRGWLDTGFIKHKFVIKDQSVLDKIHKNGIEYAFIEEKPEEKKLDDILAGEMPAEECLEKPEEKFIDLADFNNASDLYKESIKIVKDVLIDIRAGKMFNTGAVKNVAENITELTLKNKNILSSVTKLKQYDDYTFQHSMNVSIYAASLASLLGMSEGEITRIANAGILHDVGKMLVPQEVLNKPGKLTDEEFEVMKSHVQMGYEFLLKQGLPKDMLRLAYEHHERYDGSGYPNGLKDGEISIEGKIGAVVDIYDAITSDRVYHKGMEPPSALKLMFKWTDSHINKKVFEFFVLNVGIYPVGSLVLLNTNELAVVGKTNLKKPTEPVVLTFMNQKGKELPINITDLSKDGVHKKKIIGPVNPESVNIPDDIYRYIDGMNEIK